jgi:hypothetical protein
VFTIGCTYAMLLGLYYLALRCEGTLQPIFSPSRERAKIALTPEMDCQAPFRARPWAFF